MADALSIRYFSRNTRASAPRGEHATCSCGGWQGATFATTATTTTLTTATTTVLQVSTL
jgi:hypothetical protein